MKVTWVSYLSLLGRFYLAFVFLSACYHKILYPELFAVDIHTYQLLPLSLVNLMAIILPWLEAICGIALLTGFQTRASSLLMAGMLILFIVALIFALSKGLDMSCGCFSSASITEEDPISLMTIFRDLGWLAIACFIVVFDKTPLGIDYFLQKRRHAT